MNERVRNLDENVSFLEQSRKFSFSIICIRQATKNIWKLEPESVSK